MAFGEIYAPERQETTKKLWTETHARVRDRGEAYCACVFAILGCWLTLSLGCPEGKQGQVKEL